MGLNTFANIDLSTIELNRKVCSDLSDLSVNFNLCENTPDEIVNCAFGMLKALGHLSEKLLVLYDRYYTNEDKSARIENVELHQKCAISFVNSEHRQLSKILQFSGGADEIIPEIRKIAKRLRDCISYYHPFSVKVVDYAVLLVI